MEVDVLGTEHPPGPRFKLRLGAMFPKPILNVVQVLAVVITQRVEQLVSCEPEVIKGCDNVDLGSRCWSLSDQWSRFL